VAELVKMYVPRKMGADFYQRYQNQISFSDVIRLFKQQYISDSIVTKWLITHYQKVTIDNIIKTHRYFGTKWVLLWLNWASQQSFNFGYLWQNLEECPQQVVKAVINYHDIKAGQHFEINDLKFLIKKYPQSKLLGQPSVKYYIKAISKDLL
jgi:hypothetical protein